VDRIASVGVFHLLAANGIHQSYPKYEHEAYLLEIQSDILFQPYLELIYEMYIEPSLHQGDLMPHLEQFFLLDCWTKVYSSHWPMIEILNHMLQDDDVNLLQTAVSFPNFNCMNHLFPFLKVEFSELPQFQWGIFTETMNHILKNDNVAAKVNSECSCLSHVIQPHSAVPTKGRWSSSVSSQNSPVM
jgi:hypothetical protein